MLIYDIMYDESSPMSCFVSFLEYIVILYTFRLTTFIGFYENFSTTTCFYTRTL